jgi:hypothetical protein
VQKKEKDRVLHEDVMNVQDPFFLGGSSLGRLCMPIIFSEIHSGYADPAALSPLARAAFRFMVF